MLDLDNDVSFLSPPLWQEKYAVLPPIQEEMNGDEEGDPDEGRDLISWGCGEFGQHSHGHKEDVAFCDGLVKKFPTVPTKLIACGASHTILVTNDNEIYSWGNGNSGQLGTNIKELQWQPELVHLYENDPETFPEVAGVACGGRHSMVWLSNGNVFSFGNNFHAQLGYDYRSKHYKENQVKPYLLKFLVHKPVIQISCGEKHSVFRFQGGTIACVGSNNNGQIGREDLEEATIPVPIEIARPVTCVASGANHNLAITDEGEVYVWGYGKGCGSKNKDIISPEKVPFKRKRVIQVAGGGAHSLALTGSGSVYVWGGGYDGQLGLGNTVTFQSSPKKLRHSKLKNNVVQIEAGESYSAALTENGDLFVWGKNSHVIRPDKPSNSKFWLPFHINKGLRPIREVVCGAWHAAAIAGRPAPLTRFHTSEVADQDSPMASPVNGAHEDHDTSSESEGDFSELPQITVKKEPTANKETSKISIADFYSGQDVYSNEGEAPSPAFLMEDSSDNLKVDTTQMDKPESAKSRIVVQVPRPSNNVVDVATSPIPFSDSDSESQSGAKTPHVLAKPVSAKVKNVPQVNLEPLQVAPNDPRFVNSIHSGSFRSDRPHTKASVQPKYFTTPPDRERSNVCKQPSTTVIQLSKSTADNFVLPRENTGFTSRQIDLTDVEYARAVNSSKSSEKLYWINKLNESREREFLGRMQNGNALLRTVTQDCNASRGASRSGRMSDTAVVNLYCYDNVLDGTPAKWNRSIESSLGDYGRQFGNGDILEEARRAARLPPKNNTPSRSIPSKKSSEANFVRPVISGYLLRQKLQISRNDTVIAPLRAPKKNTTPRLNPMERYASVHNPASTSTKFQEKKAKLGLKTPRNVSIPDSRGNLTQEFEDICIKGETGPKQAMFSSASSWKDRGDLARMKDLRNGAMKSKTDLMISVDSKKDGTKFEKKLKMNGHDKENDLRENVTSNGKESEEDSKNGYCIEETMSDYGRMSVTQSS
ncbi:uncharacterized protein LOC125650251 isoform X3 [Ostrea edulis]|uniref:uncharacterized protein LOC125650251 isoform X3 n=1 Tax=Ostrea edulis TaxID=37623 RepID=UPI0024AFF945|nr:uncharacterized protein LOC125650251 isoform X3 [Ostrea edulis]